MVFLVAGGSKKKLTPSVDAQHKQFMEIAREHGCDESAEAFEAKLKRIAEAKPPKDDKIKK